VDSVASFPGWQQAVLKGIGAPVTPSNIRLMNAWAQAEGGGARYNPLNTTQPAGGATDFNGIGVKNYRSARQGIQATIQTLLNGHYGSILSGLRSSAAPGEIATAVGDSPWGTSGSLIHEVLGSGGGSSPPATAGGGTAPAVGLSAGRQATLTLPAPPTLLPEPKLDLGGDSFLRIAQGWDPTTTLGPSLDSLNQQLLTSPLLRAPKTDLRGHPVERTLASGGGAAPSPGGDWGGSYGPATTLAKLAERYGLQVTSTKRDTKLSASGLPSDHWVGSKNAYAYDVGGSVAEMDRAAKAITQRLGIPYNGGTLVGSKVENGLRYQILYRTDVGGNHYNHIHIGVKRVG